MVYEFTYRITSANGVTVASGHAADLRDSLAQEAVLRVGILRIASTSPLSVHDFMVEPCRYYASGCRFGDWCDFSQLVFDTVAAKLLEQKRLGIARDTNIFALCLEYALY